RGAWAQRRGDAGARRKSARALAIYGADIVSAQVRKTEANLASAGLEDCVRVMRADILELDPPADSGVMVANPPYGVRIGEESELAELYPQLGDALKAHWAGWRCHFLSADPALPKGMGLKASRRTPLFNGALECRLFEYRMFTGSLKEKG